MARRHTGTTLKWPEDTSKAKQLGVALRNTLRDSKHVDLSHLHQGDEAHASSVLQKDYYGEHALTYLCQNESCSAAMVHNIMSTPGVVDLARDRAVEGDYPIHYLASNKGIGRNPGALVAYLQHYPPAIKQRGKWGMLPLHSLCGNSGLRGECVAVLMAAYPEAADKSDGHHHKPIHYLCGLTDCTNQADGLDALLSVVPEAGIVPVGNIGHRPLDLLARNPKAPVEAFEVLLHWCPEALSLYKREMARGLPLLHVERVRAMLQRMDARRRKSMGLPPLLPSFDYPPDRGPNQHVNGGSGNSAMIFHKPTVRAPVEPPGLQRSVALNRVPQHYSNPNPKIARPPPPTPPSPVVSFPALSNPVRVPPRQEAVGPRIRTPDVFPKLHPTHREVPALAVGGEHSIAPVSPRTRFQPNAAAKDAYGRRVKSLRSKKRRNSSINEVGT